MIKGARPCSPEKGFQFREREFDGVEVGTVGRKKAQVRPDRLNGRPHLRLFVYRQVIEHDHIASLQGGHKDLFDVGEETRTVDGAIEDRRRAEAVKP